MTPPTVSIKLRSDVMRDYDHPEKWRGWVYVECNIEGEGGCGATILTPAAYDDEALASFAARDMASDMAQTIVIKREYD